ncbi:MAG: pilus assembly protein PilM [Candidatus Omnitrophota bacterium]
MRRIVGIYFGIDKINIVESLGRRVLKTVVISPSQENVNLESSDVNEQIRVVALLQKTLRDNKIEAKEAVIGISLKDIIVRFFELPIMPKKEFINALLFEVKRYLPFKIEELVFDFQARVNKAKKRAEVLFCATKKEHIDKYLAIIKEVGLKVSAVEPAILGITRLLSMQKTIDLKTATAIVELNQERGLVIIDRGWACFAHELKVSLDTKEQDVDGDSVLLLKLANEIRLTLDYYRRQSSGKHVDNLIILSDKDLPSGIVELDKELDVHIKAIKIQDVAGSIYISDLGLAIAFGLSQKDQIPLSYFKINLLSGKVPVISTERRPFVVKPVSNSQIVSYLFIGALIILLAYLVKIPEQKHLKDTLSMAVSKQPKLSARLNAMSLDELKSVEAKYKNTILKLNDLYKTRLYLTPRLDKIVRILPQGMWLTNLSINKDNVSIKGSVYLGDDTQEINLINEFIASIKKDKKLLLNLNNVDFSTERSSIGKINIRNFNIECK